MKKIHSFHIPVMGIGFTIDTPLKVSQYTMKSSVLGELEKSEVTLNQILLDIQKYKLNIRVQGLTERRVQVLLIIGRFFDDTLDFLSND